MYINSFWEKMSRLKFSYEILFRVLLTVPNYLQKAPPHLLPLLLQHCPPSTLNHLQRGAGPSRDLRSRGRSAFPWSLERGLWLLRMDQTKCFPVETKCVNKITSVFFNLKWHSVQSIDS